jgi:hypothetical protein
MSRFPAHPVETIATALGAPPPPPQPAHLKLQLPRGCLAAAVAPLAEKHNYAAILRRIPCFLNESVEWSLEWMLEEDWPNAIMLPDANSVRKLPNPCLLAMSSKNVFPASPMQDVPQGSYQQASFVLHT